MGSKNESVATAAPMPGPSLEPVAKKSPPPTPDHWARIAFPVTKRGNLSALPHPNYWQHKAAAALHGWAAHEHHAGAPMQLTAEAYYEALVAASKPNKSGEYIPHFPALSPHAPFAIRLAEFAKTSKAS